MSRAAHVPIVKICGLRRPEDVHMCIRHGTDILGFVVDYSVPVPWDLTVIEAKTLMSEVSLPTETCVVTGGTTEHVCKIAAELMPTYIQMHWETSPEDTARLVERLGQLDVKLIQAIFSHTPDLEQTARAYSRAGVYAMLMDSRTPNHAEQGGAADIAIWRKIQNAVACPVILAGGITPGNAAECVKGTGVQMIDLMTGVESAPGVKDECRVEELFRVLGNCAND